MKYIRTKDGIREIIHDNGNSCAVKSNHWTTIDGFTVIFGLTYAPRADRIEELCDVFVKISKETKNDYFRIGEDSNIIFDKKFENYKKWFNYYDYYGAIWTPKGLIYVAKMNDKGELELL